MCACDRSIAAIPPRAVAAHGPCDVVGRATYGNTYGAAQTQTSQWRRLKPSLPPPMMPAFWRGRAVVGPPHRSTVDALWCIAQHNTQTARPQQSQREEKKHRHWLARISAARLGNSLAEKPFLDAFVSIYFFFRSKQQQQKKFFVHTKAILLFKYLSGCGWWFDCCCCLCSYIVVWLLLSPFH